MSVVLEQSEIERSLKRIAHEIIERNHGLDSVILMGIPTRGVTLAQRIGEFLRNIEKPVPVGTLDITMFRDDLRLRPPRALAKTLLKSIKNLNASSDRIITSGTTRGPHQRRRICLSGLPPNRCLLRSWPGKR